MESNIHLRALLVALTVGSLLAIINHGDKLFAANMTNSDWLKLGLTYLVPYGVSWFSAVRAQKEHH